MYFNIEYIALFWYNKQYYGLMWLGMFCHNERVY